MSLIGGSLIHVPAGANGAVVGSFYYTPPGNGVEPTRMKFAAKCTDGQAQSGGLTLSLVNAANGQIVAGPAQTYASQLELALTPFYASRAGTGSVLLLLKATSPMGGDIGAITLIYQ